MRTVALHRRLELGVPPEVVTADLEALFVSKDALAREIRRERASAPQGEIFTPAVAGYLRVVIADALSRGGIDDFLAIVEEDQEDDDVRLIPTVNGDYPAGASIRSWLRACWQHSRPCQKSSNIAFLVGTSFSGISMRG